MVALGIALIFVPLPGAIALLPFLLSILTWVLIALRAARAAARAPQPYTLQPYNRWYWYAPAVLFCLFVWRPTVLRYITSRWVQAFQIPSNSMDPTILPGDFVLVSKQPGKELHRNDLVVYETPAAPGIMILKRIVGVAGDTLAMRNGVLIRNGDTLVEPFTKQPYPIDRIESLTDGRRWQVDHLVRGDPRTYRPDMRNWGPILVPKDSVFILGDNRDYSFDSRFSGALPVDHVRGRPLYIYFSKTRKPDSFSIRWSRIGHRF